MISPSELGNDELLQSLGELVGSQHRLTSALVAHLAEVDARRLHVEAGYPSLFQYCLEVLNFTEDEAYRRIAVARVARLHPAAFGLLEGGELSLSVLLLLKDHLTEANHAELFAGVSRMSARRATEWLASRFPKPDAPERIRKLPTPAPVVASASGRSSDGLDGARDVVDPVPQDPPSRPISEKLPSRPKVKPLSTDRFKLELTMSRKTRDELERVRGLLRHRCPDGSLETILEMALTALTEKIEKERFGATTKPRQAREPRDAESPKRGRSIPAHVRRAVMARDGARCSHVSPDGKRCGSTDFLEFDHVHPVGRGGTCDIDNVRVLCRAHNRLAAEKIYGKQYVQEWIDLSRRVRSSASKAPSSPRD